MSKQGKPDSSKAFLSGVRNNIKGFLKGDTPPQMAHADSASSRVSLWSRSKNKSSPHASSSTSALPPDPSLVASPLPTPTLEVIPIDRVHPLQSLSAPVLPVLSGAGNPTISTISGDNDLHVELDAIIEDLQKAQDFIGQERDRWTYINKNGKKVDGLDRVGRFLISIKHYSGIVDTAIQHSPEITSLVWAGAKFILEMAINKVQFMENLEEAIATIIHCMATCEFYAHIYNDITHSRFATARPEFKERMKLALEQFRESVKKFGDAMQPYIQDHRSLKSKLSIALKPFSLFLEPLVRDIVEKTKGVEQTANMATMKEIVAGSESLRNVEYVVNDIARQLAPLAEELMKVTMQTLNVVQKSYKATMALTTEVSGLRAELVEALQPHHDQWLSTTTTLAEGILALEGKYTEESREANYFNPDLYVPTRGMAHPQALESEHFDLELQVQEFLAHDSGKTVCLIQGTGGTGKSTFNHYLAHKLWTAYKNPSATQHATSAIPIFISLANLIDSNNTSYNQDLIAKLFESLNWPMQHIQEARRKLQFVFILDGYDEIAKRDRNFYVDCKFQDWNAKVIITSRPEYLGLRYQAWFHPPGQPQRLQEYFLAPFSEGNVRLYIAKYLKNHNTDHSPSRSAEEYEQLILQPEFRDLIGNPFLLHMVMTVDPTTLDPGNRRQLYSQFINHLLEASHARLSRVQLPARLREQSEILRLGDCTYQVRSFCQAFAVELYRHNVLEATYVEIFGAYKSSKTAQAQQKYPWAQFLSNDDAKIQLLRFMSPLIRIGHSYRFLHKSLRDYLIAESLGQDNSDELWQEFNIVEDPGVIDFVVAEAKEDQNLQERLLSFIEQSKSPSIDTHRQTAAANAITTLVKAGHRFGNCDLRGISIPGADLTSGWFDQADLENSDLTGVRFGKIWLRKANMRGARMKDVAFGEMPYFELPPAEKPLAAFEFLDLRYAADGELFAACDCSLAAEPNSGGPWAIEVWSISRKKKVFRSSEYSGTRVVSPILSQDCALVAGGLFKTDCLGQVKVCIEIWSISSGTLVSMAITDSELPASWPAFMTFSPNNKLLLSLNRVSSSIQVWSVATGSLLCTTPPQRSDYYAQQALAFSPDGEVFAACGYTSTQLWSYDYCANKIEELRTFEHRNAGGAHAIAFSPDGTLFASNTLDSIWLWSLALQQAVPIDIAIDFGGLATLAFAPNGRLLASRSNRGILSLWSTSNGQKVFETVDSYRHKGIAFSPEGQRLASSNGGILVQQIILPEATSMSQSILDARAQVPGVGRFDTPYVSPDGLRLATFHYVEGFRRLALDQMYFRFWSVVGDELIIPGSQCFVNDVSLFEGMPHACFSPDGSLFAICNKGTYVCVLSLPDGKPVGTGGIDIPVPAHHRIRSITFSTEDNDKLLVFSSDLQEELMLTSLSFKLCLAITSTHTFQRPGSGPGTLSPARCWAWHGSLLACVADEPGSVLMYLLPGCEPMCVLQAHPGGCVQDTKFSSDGLFFATASLDQVRLWSTADFQCIHTFTDAIEPVTRVVFSPDGELLASLETNSLRIYSIQAKICISHESLHHRMHQMFWRAAGYLILIGSFGTIELWRVKRDGADMVSCECTFSSTYGSNLNINEVNIEGAVGLDDDSIELLRQRGSIGAPSQVENRVVEECE